jgi:hypothetical protein
MNTIKSIIILTIFTLISSIAFAQTKDSTDAEIIKIMSLLEDEEKREIIIVAKSQQKFTAEEELSWVLANMDDNAKSYVLRYIESKAGSRLKKKGVADIYWIESSFDFGKISEGKFVSHKFEFENIGDVPYVIQDVEGSCGCTIADYTKKAIPPGGKGVITVRFNSIGKVGENTEFVTVIGNSQPEHVSLLIEAEVYENP